MKQGWEFKKLGDVCTIDWGNTALTKKSYVDGGKYLAVSAAGCDGRIDCKEHNKYTPTLSAIGARCGRMFFPVEDFTAIKNTMTFTPDEAKVYNKFLYYLLTSSELPQRGSAQPFISKGDIQKFNVLLPTSLEEQKQIVAKLDQCFEAIDKAKANAAKNLENTKELFQSKLNEIFSQKGEGWVEKKLGDVCSLEYGKPLPKEDRDPDGLYPAYGANGIKTRTDKFLVNGRSIIVGRKGSAGEINYTEDKFWALDVTYYTKFDSNILDLDFLYYLLSLLKLPKLAKGVKPGINRNDVYAITIQLPPLKEQSKIAIEMKHLGNITNSLESKYQQELNSLEELKKSILQKAFEGEL